MEIHHRHKNYTTNAGFFFREIRSFLPGFRIYKYMYIDLNLFSPNPKYRYHNYMYIVYQKKNISFFSQ